MQPSRGTNMSYKLYIAGARGSRPICGEEYLQFGGGTSCYIITNGTYALLIDCGSGISQAGDILKNCTDIDIILTHVHYDHILGLLDGEVLPQGVRPRLFGTFDKWGMNNKDGNRFTRKPFWPIEMPYRDMVTIEWNASYTFGLEGEIQGDIYESNHPDEACMVCLTVGGSKILLMCDYEHGKEFPEGLIDCYDLMIYDGMYTEEEYPKYAGYGHSTMEKGIELARSLKAKHLVITHLDPKKTDDILLEIEGKLQADYPNCEFARAGAVYEIG